MKKASVVVILVNWNGKQDTIKCLESLGAINHSKYEPIPLVVDNASSDDSVSLLKKTFPTLEVITLKTNKGFAGANNIGMQWAINHNAEYVWILNNDTHVSPSSLTLFDVFTDSTVGAAGSKIYFSAGREYHANRYTKKQQGRIFWYAGGIIDWANIYAFHRGVDEVDTGQYDEVEETDFITGCSFGMPVSVVKKVGMFDERYFVYLEDVDLSLRIQRAGLKTLYAPRSVVWHNNASSSGGPGSAIHQYYQARNRLLLGFTYANMRTKLALLRQAGTQLLKGTPMQKKAISSVLRGNFGAYHE